jgi:ribosomal protein L29
VGVVGVVDAENQPVPLLPLHPAGHAGGGTEPLASGAGAPHLVPTATLFAAGMGTLPVVHSDYDGTLTSTTTSSASMAMTTSMASSSMVRGGTYQGATEGQDQTSALVLGSISEVKNELAEVKDELHSVHMMKAEMREMKRRLEQLEEDNSQLKGAVIELRTQTGSGNPTRPRQFRVEVSQGQQGQGPPLKKIRWMGYEALSPEMLWCFPFLENINISRSNFVVDDLEYVPSACATHPPHIHNDVTRKTRPTDTHSHCVGALQESDTGALFLSGQVDREHGICQPAVLQRVRILPRTRTLAAPLLLAATLCAREVIS